MIIVARPRLGTINHTFLTVKYAESMGFQSPELSSMESVTLLMKMKKPILR